MNKKVLLSTIVASMFVANSFAADTTNTNNEVNLSYEVNNDSGVLKVAQDSYQYSIDNYVYIKLSEDSIGKISNLEFAMDKEAKDIAYVCTADEEVNDISFEKYMQKVDSLTDEEKKKACSTEFIYAITDIAGDKNTFDFKKDDTFATLTLNDKTYTKNPFVELSTKDADNKDVNTFKIEEIKPVVEEKKEEPKPVVEEKKEEKKVVNTKKTGLGTNILLMILMFMVIGVIGLKRNITSK